METLEQHRVDAFNEATREGMQEGCIDNTTVPGHQHHKMGCKRGSNKGHK